MYAAACYRPFQVTFDVIKRLKNSNLESSLPFDENELEELFSAADEFKKKIGVFMRTYAAISGVFE